MHKSSILALIFAIFLPLFQCVPLPLSGSNQALVQQTDIVPEVFAGPGSKGLYDTLYNRFYGPRFFRPEFMYFSDLDLLSPKQRRSPSFGVDGTDFRMLQALEGSRKPRFGKRGEWDGRLIQALENVRKPRFGKRAVASFKRTVSNFNDYSIIQAMENIRKPRFGKRSTPVLAKIQSQDQQIFP